MKKNVMTYIVVCLALILVKILAYGVLWKINLLVFMIVNIVIPSLIVIIASGIIHYGNKGTVKKCLLNAVALAMLSLLVNFGATGLMGTQMKNYLLEKEEEQNLGGSDLEIFEELDRQARQKMLDEGLISEGDEIYSEPFMGSNYSNEISEKPLESEKLTGTWDVQMEGESMSSTVTGVILDIVLAFISGLVAAKIGEKRKRVGEASDEI